MKIVATGACLLSCLLCSLFTLFTLFTAPNAEAQAKRSLLEFESKKLDAIFYQEGATSGDISGDGVVDIISGPFWYEGPDFQMRHEFYPARAYDIGGYSNNFFAFVQDFDRDGLNDILVVGFPGKDASWFRNPGMKDGRKTRKKTGVWKRHVVLEPVDNESPTFTDITGDGKPELVCCSKGYFGYAEPDASDPDQPWRFVKISADRGAGRFTHGLGVGDINGDGRSDLLEKSGWYEQPESLSGDPEWKHHAIQFSGAGGAQMYVYDVDGDGDGDVITSLAAHGYGLAWYEHETSNDGISFRKHVIMGKSVEESDYDLAFSGLHAIDLVDMDGDGLRDIVTGKRFWAHMGKGPGELDPPVVYWFQLQRKKSGVDFVPHLISSESGVGTQVVARDVNADGLPDIIVGNKKGTFIHLQRRQKVSEAAWKLAQPRRVVRHGQSPSKAAKTMTAPEGFHVELVAGEPQVHQPVAFTIDHRGRIWVAEGFTYPQRQPEGQGKDNILVLEDTNGDGTFDGRKVFASGVNLISGIEVGFGGVWVGAAPYLMFFPDANDDAVLDGPPEIVLDGWGYQDTHETLNSFIWGPDGWLYGCHGIFTHSKVGKPGTPGEKRVPLNAGVWRFHPQKHDFEVFAWGTSNPWGLDFNEQGEAFVTACVIPHLFHMIQGARYQRQAGRHFNAHVYDDIKTIADHLHHGGKRWTADHFAASDSFGGGHAHCGALIYLGDNFPASYRGKVLMNNIHGNRINVDALVPDGSGYVGRHEKDFVFANDKWYRGITLKTGPDGSVYFSDWYDRQACHRREPEIWDRSNGRIFNVRFGDERKRPVDIARLSDSELVALQLHKNDYHVRQARRILQERGSNANVHASLAKMFREHSDPTRKLRALWALHVTHGVTTAIAKEALASPHEHVRAWIVRLLAEENLEPWALERFATLSRQDESLVVRLALASSMQRMALTDRWRVAEGLARDARASGDHNLPLMIWYGIEPAVPESPDRALGFARGTKTPLLTRYIIRRLSSRVDDLDPLMRALGRSESAAFHKLVLEEMLSAFASRTTIRQPKTWDAAYEALEKSQDPELREKLEEVAVKFGDRRIFPVLRAALADRDRELSRRQRALSVLLNANDPELPPILAELLDDPLLRGQALRGLASYDSPSIPAAILTRYDIYGAREKMDAVTTLSSRPAYAKALLEAVRDGNVPRTDLSAFTVRQIAAFRSPELDSMIQRVWGSMRKTSAEKTAEIAKYKKTLTPKYIASGDARRGRTVFAKTCAQCHLLFGTGGTIAPDLTGSNRANLDYLLENVLDPNAVVGKDYRLNEFVTKQGRVVAGLIRESNEDAISIQTVNDIVVLARKSIEMVNISESSMMPEGLLANLKTEELRDLVAYLGSKAQVPMKGAPVVLDPKTRRVVGALEGEKLKVLRKTGSAAPQDMKGFGLDKWSANAHLFWTGAKPKDRLELELPVARKGNYRLEVALTMAPDYGIIQLSLDGKAVDAPLDLYDPKVVPTGSLFLGEFQLEAGTHRFGIEILGANPRAAKNHFVGVDFLLLRPVGE